MYKYIVDNGSQIYLVGMIFTVLVMNSEALSFYSEIEKMYKYIVDNGSQIYHYSQRELYTEKARRLDCNLCSVCHGSELAVLFMIGSKKGRYRNEYIWVSYLFFLFLF